VQQVDGRTRPQGSARRPGQVEAALEQVAGAEDAQHRHL
jgi:hypothetical protein